MNLCNVEVYFFAFSQSNPGGKLTVIECSAHLTDLKTTTDMHQLVKPEKKKKKKRARGFGVEALKYLFAAGFGAFVSFQSSVCFHSVRDHRVQQLSPSVIPHQTETCRPPAFVI